MGYAATYYGYMWSEVFAQDVFQYIKDHDGLLSPEMGKRYVECIIGVGGGQDPNVMLRNFLGREPNADAFLKKLGV
jgi:thimet oligopeptidase